VSERRSVSPPVEGFTGGLTPRRSPTSWLTAKRVLNTDSRVLSWELIGQVPLELLDFVVDPSG
jgi:hypothetical protein